MTRPKALKISSPSESAEQIGFLRWFEEQFPAVRIMHIPNGGHRAISVAKKLRAEGVQPGVPDLYIPEWRLWVEMKRAKGGRLSAAQRDWIEYLEGIGDAVIVGHGAADAGKKVLDILNDNKNRNGHLCNTEHRRRQKRCAGVAEKSGLHTKPGVAL